MTDADYDTFFQLSESDDPNDGGTQLHGTDPMPRNYLHFFFMGTWYAVGTGRKWLHGYLTRKGKLTPSAMCFKKITPSDEAWAVANVVNQYDGWCQKFEK